MAAAAKPSTAREDGSGAATMTVSKPMASLSVDNPPATLKLTKSKKVPTSAVMPTKVRAPFWPVVGTQSPEAGQLIWTLFRSVVAPFFTVILSGLIPSPMSVA